MPEPGDKPDAKPGAKPGARGRTVTVVREYRLVRRLGRGGMADVYVAEVVGIDGPGRQVAFKRMRSLHSANETIEGYFRREGRVGMQLRHPNIVEVYDAGQDSHGRPFLVMELVDGTTLYAMMQAGDVPLDTSVYVMTQVLHGLAHAHQRDIFHRDVSPQNILVSRTGDIKLGDFGLAKIAGDGLVSANGLKGRWEYVAPRAAQHDRADPRSDLYAVGVILYELTTGQFPHGSATGPQYLARALSDPPIPPSELREDLPAELDAIILQLLQQDYAAATDVIDDLAALPAASAETLARRVDELLDDDQPPDLIDPEPHRATPSVHAEPEPGSRRPRRRLRVAALLAALITAAAVGGGITRYVAADSGDDALHSPPIQPAPHPASDERDETADLEPTVPEFVQVEIQPRVIEPPPSEPVAKAEDREPARRTHESRTTATEPETRDFQRGVTAMAGELDQVQDQIWFRVPAHTDDVYLHVERGHRTQSYFFLYVDVFNGDTDPYDAASFVVEGEDSKRNYVNDVRLLSGWVEAEDVLGRIPPRGTGRAVLLLEAAARHPGQSMNVTVNGAPGYPSVTVARIQW